MFVRVVLLSKTPAPDWAQKYRIREELPALRQVDLRRIELVQNFHRQDSTRRIEFVKNYHRQVDSGGIEFLTGALGILRSA